MVARRSLRTRSVAQDVNVLKTRDDNVKRKTSSDLPRAKRRKVETGTARVTGRDHCAIADVVTAVLSDSPMSKCSTMSDEEDVKLDLDDAKRNLFQVEVKTPKGKERSEEIPEAPKSAGKFFKNRTPQKSKVQAARSKSISLIRQTCLGQKIKVKDKGQRKVKVTKPARKYDRLKFMNDCVEKKKENICVVSELSDVVDEDTGIVMSDENSPGSLRESECNSLVSGPALPSPIFPQNITQKLHLLSKPDPKVASPKPLNIASPGQTSDVSMATSSTSSFSMLSLQKLPDEVQTTSSEILAGSIMTRSAGSSPALSTRSQRSLALFTRQEGASLIKGLGSPGSRDIPCSLRQRAQSGQPSPQGSEDTVPPSQDSAIVPSSQLKQSSQEKISEILEEFMSGDDFHPSPKKKHFKSPTKSRAAKIIEQEVRRSPRKLNKISPSITPLKSDEVIFYPVFTNSPRQEHYDSPTVKLPKLIADKRQEGLEQTALDFGQRDLGTTQCKTCRMVYNQKDPEDEKSHVAFHQRLLTALKFRGWKSERIAQQLADGGRIIIVLPEDKQVQKKISQIQQVVDKDLGFLEVKERPKYMKQTYLYISGDKRVEGYCVAEAITSAFPVLTDSQRSQKEGGRQKAWCCSTESVVAKCGISRVWVFSEARRKGIATKILDCVRYRFFMGVLLEKMDLAFTDPTPLGRAFATNYIGTENFLVYK